MGTSEGTADAPPCDHSIRRHRAAPLSVLAACSSVPGAVDEPKSRAQLAIDARAEGHDWPAEVEAAPLRDFVATPVVAG